MNLREVDMHRPAYTKQLTRVCCREWQTVWQGAGLAAQGLITSLACTLATGENGWRELSFHQNSECGVRKIAPVVLGMACCGHKHSHFISWTDIFLPIWFLLMPNGSWKFNKILIVLSKLARLANLPLNYHQIQKHIIACFLKDVC